MNFVAPGEEVPGVPPSLSEMLAADFDMIADSSEIARRFGVHQTTLEEVVQRSIEAMAAR